MDFDLPKDNDPRRLEVRAWFDGHPKPTGRLLFEAGYVVPHWPKPWSLDADTELQMIIDDEIKRAGLPAPNSINPVAINNCAQSLLTHGTKAQQDRFLPPALSYEEGWWRQLAKLGVDVRLASTVDADLLAALTPDIVFVATGSAPVAPQHMINIIMKAANIEIMMLDDLLEERLTLGDNILVIGGDQNGMLAADYLSEGGRKVTVAEAHGHFGQKLAAHDRWYLLNRQNAKNVRRVKDVHNVEVGGNDDVWLVTDAGRELLPDIDTIVFASDRRSDRTVVELAKAAGCETYLVGDAHDVVSENSGTIFANIAHTYDVARQI